MYWVQSVCSRYSGSAPQCTDSSCCAPDIQLHNLLTQVCVPHLIFSPKMYWLKLLCSRYSAPQSTDSSLCAPDIQPHDVLTPVCKPQIFIPIMYWLKFVRWNTTLCCEIQHYNVQQSTVLWNNFFETIFWNSYARSWRLVENCERDFDRNPWAVIALLKPFLSWKSREKFQGLRPQAPLWAPPLDPPGGFITDQRHKAISLAIACVEYLVYYPLKLPR